MRKAEVFLDLCICYQAFNDALDALNVTKEDVLGDPLLLRRILQLHIIPVPLPENVLTRDNLRVPTLDFGSRLQIETEDGVTTIASGDTVAEVLDIQVSELCKVINVH